MADSESKENRRLMTVLLGLLSIPLVLFTVTLIAGALSPREHTVSESAPIDASPEQVYQAISDIGFYPEWRRDLEGVEVLDRGEHPRWRERADGQETTYEVVESEPPARLVTRIADEELPWGGTWTYTLSPEGSGTEITIREDGWVDNLVFRGIARFVFGYERTIREYLEDLSEYAPSVTVPPPAPEPEGREIDLQGHRGARGLAPENTLAGFRRALAVGVTTLEMDLALTADGVVVVHHDERLNPDTTRDADGAFIDPSRSVPIRSLTYEQLSVFDVGRLRPGSEYAARFVDQEPVDGEHIPTLAEVLALAEEVSGGTIRYNLEIKRTPTSPEDTAEPATFVQAVLEVVRGAGTTDRTTFQSFDFACIDALFAVDDGLELACLTSLEVDDPLPWLGGRNLDDFEGSLVRLVGSVPCQTWSPRFADLDATLVREAHDFHLRVVPWTINEPEAIAQAYDMGVDGIISDRPERVRDFLLTRSAPLPPSLSAASR